MSFLAGRYPLFKFRQLDTGILTEKQERVVKQQQIQKSVPLREKTRKNCEFFYLKIRHSCV